MRQVVRVVTVALLGVGMTAAPALAAWTGNAPGSSRAKATTLAAPTGVSATAVSPTTSAIDISFVLATNPPGTTYVVTRDKTTTGAAGPQVVSGCAALTASPCHDTGLASGTTYTYTVKAVLQSWNGTTASAGASTSAATVQVSTLTLANVGTGNTGKVNENDTITIAFSAAVRPTSICSSFSDVLTTAQTIGDGSATNGAFTLSLKDNAATPVTTNDQLSITATTAGCSGGLNFGSLDLGSPSWTTANRSYQGNGSNATFFTLNGAHTQLIVTVGAGTVTPTTGSVSAATSTFTPSSGIKDDATNSVSVSGTQTTTTLF